MITRGHLKDNDLGYFEHMGRSVMFGLKSGLASIIFFIHAVFPCFCTTAGGILVTDIAYDIYTDHTEEAHLGIDVP